MAAFRPIIWAEAFKYFFGQQPGALDLITRYDQFVGQGTRGDTIQIPALTLPNSIAIVPGSVGGTQTPTDIGAAIVLNQFYGHPIPVTSLDDRLTHPDYMNGLMREAGHKIKQQTNASVCLLVDDGAVTQVANASTGGAIGDPEVLESMRLLDEAEMPKQDRVALVTADGYKDLMGLDTFTSRLYGEGQSQIQIDAVRGFQVVELPKARFPNTASVYRQLFFQKGAIGGAMAQPHLELVQQAGQFQRILEVGAIFGLKVLYGAGCVRVYR